MLLSIKKSRELYIDELEKQATSNFVEIDGCKIHYVEFGSGPILVLIHGWNNDWTGFVPFIKELNGFRVIAVDLPGYGKSDELQGVYTVGAMAKSLAGLFEALKVKPDIVCCLSMGSVVGVEFATTYPKLLKSLVLIGPPIIKYDWILSKLYRQYITLLNSNSVLRFIGKKIMSEGWYGHLTAKYVNMYKYDKKLIDRYGMRGRQRIKARTIFEMGKSMYHYHMSRKMRDLVIPTLIIVGRFDKLIDLDEAVKISTEKDNISLSWVEESGHVVSLEKPKSSAESIRKFSKKEKLF